jgi:hypothetical protein
MVHNDLWLSPSSAARLYHMQITVTIPDDFAAQVQARGLTPERYVETLIAEQARIAPLPADTLTRLADLESFFDEMAAHSPPSNAG